MEIVELATYENEFDFLGKSSLLWNETKKIICDSNSEHLIPIWIDKSEYRKVTEYVVLYTGYDCKWLDSYAVVSKCGTIACRLVSAVHTVGLVARTRRYGKSVQCDWIHWRRPYMAVNGSERDKRMHTERHVEWGQTVRVGNTCSIACVRCVRVLCLWCGCVFVCVSHMSERLANRLAFVAVIELIALHVDSVFRSTDGSWVRSRCH